MNKIEFYGGGFPFENKTIEFLQDNFNDALKGLAGIGGIGNFIISGLIQTGSTVSAGWIYYGGELIYFEGGTKTDNFIIEETVENKIYQDGVSHPAYITKHAKFGNGTSPIAFSVLQRLPNLLEMQSLITSIIDFETSVIVTGCVRSNISVSPTTLDISAGMVMIDNSIFVTPGYSGQYPVWIDKDGQFVNAQPSTGSYIKFDPHTSQDKSSVIRRAVYQTGDIIHKVVLNDRFDNTGLGKWEMKGFALMNGANGTVDKRGRVGLAYDGRGADPGLEGGVEVWDANYNTPGNKGGKKRHALASNEQGPGITPHSGAGGMIEGYSTNNAPGSDNYDPINIGGTVQPHENRQPYLVEVHAQRI